MTRKHFVLLALLIIITSPMPIPTMASAQAHDEEAFIKLRPGVKGTPHPMRVEDILSLRAPLEPKISPDGKAIAFIVKQAFLDLNEYRSALFVVRRERATEPVKLVEEKELSQVQWSPDAAFITYVSARSGTAQIWRVSPQGGTPEQISHHESGIASYDWSADGRRIAFVSSDTSTTEEKSRLERSGVIFNDTYAFGDLINKSWIKKPSQLWVCSLPERKEEKIWEHTSPVGEIVWSPDGRAIAVMYKASNSAHDVNNQDIGVVSLAEKIMRPLATSETWEGAATWSPDGKSIAYASWRQEKGMFPEFHRLAILVAGVDTGMSENLTPSFPLRDVTHVRWSKDGTKIFFESDDRSRSTLYELPSKGGAVRTVIQGNDHLSEFSFTEDQSVVSCIRQNPVMPPDVVVIDLRNGSPTVVTALNPQFDDVTFGQVSELRWRNKYGMETNGFLIKPVGYVLGQRYPFLLMLYGFTGKFISDAQWITSYPAQVFAASGFAVLMMNYPEFHAWRYGDFKQYAFSEFYNPLASIEKAVEVVMAMGIGDPDRAGIMGWSMGSFWTDLAITHADLFKVASSGEGGWRNPGTYWLSGGSFQHVMDGMFGGPPLGKWYQNYSQVSPALIPPNLQVPVLREYEAHNMTALEVYTAWKKQGAQVELVLYPDDEHSFVQPRHRLASMQRNVDWFRFWLQGKEDPNPAKREQYTRWKAMRDALQKKQSTSTR